MGDSPDFQASDQRRQRAWVNSSDWVDESEPKLSKEERQALAHERGRICKERGCDVCAPLREQRRLKKVQRKAEAQAQAHATGQPCGRTSCELDLCVAARNAPAAAPQPAAQPPVEPISDDRQTDSQQTVNVVEDPAEARRREAKRHRVGLPCGSEDCPKQECIDGFVKERTRRHRARRPCRSSTCGNPICVSGRSSN